MSASHFKALKSSETMHIQFSFKNSKSLWVPEQGSGVVSSPAHSLIPPPIRLYSSVVSTRNHFQLFMPIFHKYLGDGISKQTMPGDTNPRL